MATPYTNKYTKVFTDNKEDQKVSKENKEEINNLLKDKELNDLLEKEVQKPKSKYERLLERFKLYHKKTNNPATENMVKYAESRRNN